MCDARTGIRKPRWSLLYGLVTVFLGLLGLVETGVPEGAVRRVLEAIVAVAMFGAMAIWVRVNRASFDVAGPRWDSAARSPRAPERSGAEARRSIDRAAGTGNADTRRRAELPRGR